MDSFSIIEGMDVESSYKNNNFGFMMYSLIRLYKPEKCYEFGVLDGYSTVSIACALRDNKLGNLTAVDLFEDYQYKNSTINSVEQRLQKYDLEECVSLVKNDVFSEIQNIEVESLDFVHLDISNDEEKLKNFLFYGYDKMKKGCVFLFEGGSKERDEVGWMKKFNKGKITNVFDQEFNSKFDFLTFEPFPSLTFCRKK